MTHATSWQDDEPKWLNIEEMRAWRCYIDGSQRLLAVLHHELSEAHGLSFADYRILVLLSEAESNSLRMSELADGIVSSRSRLSHQMERLEAAGLVRREACPDDRRGILATLTDYGRQRLVEAAPTHLAGVRRYLVDQLSPVERRTLAAIFERVEANAR